MSPVVYESALLLIKTEQRATASDVILLQNAIDCNYISMVGHEEFGGLHLPVFCSEFLSTKVIKFSCISIKCIKNK